MAFGGTNILDMALREGQARFPNLFRGRGNGPNKSSYSFAVNDVPTAQLMSATGRTPNVAIDLGQVAVTIQIGTRTVFNSTMAMTARGRFGIANGVLSITSVAITVGATGGLTPVIQQIINNQVVPAVQRMVSAIPIPQLQDIFGDGLSAEVRSGGVTTGASPSLEVDARITGRTGDANADMLPAADRAALRSGSATDARVGGMVSSAAANVLIARLTPALSYPFDRTVNNAAGIRGTVSATTPRLRIVNGVATATTTVSVSLRAGINVPFVGWRFVDVPVPTVTVAVTNRLRADGRNGLVVLTNVASISVNISLPGLLSPVGTLIRNAVNAVIGLFRGNISAAIAGTTIPVFQLPTRIPGMSIPATLSFATGGLTYSGSSIRAVVRVRA
jgi:hypothetical protein